MAASTKRAAFSLGLKDINAPQDKVGGATSLHAVPDPTYRHAAPSEPWPWMNLQVVFRATKHATPVDKSWRGYPQNQFGNWTPDQVQRRKMFEKCSMNLSSTIYWMDVCEPDGKFATSDMGEHSDITVVSSQNPDTFWNLLQGKRPKGIRVRSLFVDDLTQPVLRILGTRYNIEPFFFTSSINWIPSRYQEAPRHGEGDHITITLPFIRTHVVQESQPPPIHPSPTDSWDSVANTPINIQAPISMGDDRMLLTDLLAIHMVRDVKENTIISYHPESTSHWTSAKHLHSLMKLVGESVYWQKIFSRSKDPTFLFLAILWYALYAWDESFELLYNYVSQLELQVLHTDNISLTRKLHVLQARLLHYQSLLHGFEVSVKFIEMTPNPAMESDVFNDKQRTESVELMKKECGNLLSEIDRLEMRRTMLSSRLQNAMNLAFATVNTEDSRRMQRLSYLTMVFLPASFIASIFGMNVKEINNGTQTVAHYVETTIGLTLVTIYIVFSLQKQSWVHRRQDTLVQRLAWPILFPWRQMHRQLECMRRRTVDATA